MYFNAVNLKCLGIFNPEKWEKSKDFEEKDYARNLLF